MKNEIGQEEVDSSKIPVMFTVATLIEEFNNNIVSRWKPSNRIEGHSPDKMLINTLWYSRRDSNPNTVSLSSLIYQISQPLIKFPANFHWKLFLARGDRSEFSKDKLFRSSGSS